MALPDPRTGGSCIKCLSNRVVCIVVGWLQVVIWTIGTVTLIFSPSSVSTLAAEMNTTQHIISIFVGLACIAFSLMFVFGVHKDRRIFVKIYCFYVVTFLVLIIVSFFINLCMKPRSIDFKYVFSLVFNIVFLILCFFIARGYYLITYCNNTPQNLKNDQGPA